MTEDIEKEVSSLPKFIRVHEPVRRSDLDMVLLNRGRTMFESLLSVFTRDILVQDMDLDKRYNMVISGSSGNGKTTLVEQYAASVNAKIINNTIHSFPNCI